MKSSSTSSLWVIRPQPNPQMKFRLFCFPYAGSGTSGFNPWLRVVSPDIEMCLIRLPGRESRFTETPFTALKPLVEVLTSELIPYLDQPFAFFGHSMGSFILFEAARELRRQQQVNPNYLFVSGRHAPHKKNPSGLIYNLPEDEFIKKIESYNGIPKEILQNKEMMELVLPILRADFTLLETYNYTPEESLSIPIMAFGGLNDTVDEEGLSAWEEVTDDKFSLKMFPGGHFFIQEHYQEILKIIDSELLHNYY